MPAINLPWAAEKPWPPFQEIAENDVVENFNVPEWASILAGIGYWHVRTGIEGHHHRSVLLVPVRNTAMIWVALGGLIASVQTSRQKSVEVGDTVWFPPRPCRTRFTKGKVLELPTGQSDLFRIETSRGRNRLIELRC